MANKRCRMHGGKSTGARTAEGLQQCRAASLRHGRRSAAALAERRETTARARAVTLETSALLKEVDAYIKGLRKGGRGA